MTENQPFTVLYVASWGRKLYGGEQALLNTFHFLDRSAFRPIAALNKSGELSNILITRGETVAQVNYDWLRTDPIIDILPSAVGVIHGAFRLSSIINNHKVKLIHSVDGESLQAAFLASMWTRTPLIFTMNNDVEYPQINRWILRRLPAVIAVSGAAKDRLLSFGVSATKIHHYSLGINPEQYISGDGSRIRSELGLPTQAPLIGTIASLQQRKRQDILIRAAVDVLKSFPNAYFLLVGDSPCEQDEPSGSYSQKLRSLAIELGVQQRVIFAGFRTDVADILHALDIAVMCSDEETLGLANLEAMAAGIPVVATRSGGILDVVQDGLSGVLIPRGDQNALASVIVHLLEEPDQRRRMGEYGRQVVQEKFAVKQFVRSIESLYSQHLGAITIRGSALISTKKEG